MRALDIASTGMQSQQLNVEVISNNIANLNTTGYKRQRAEFQDLLYQSIRRPGDTSSDAGTVVPVGVPTRVAPSKRNAIDSLPISSPILFVSQEPK